MLPWWGVGFFQHHDAISFQLVFRNHVCGIVSVRQVLEYVEIEIHERKQNEEAEYIWLLAEVRREQGEQDFV